MLADDGYFGSTNLWDIFGINDEGLGFLDRKRGMGFLLNSILPPGHRNCSHSSLLAGRLRHW
jgi:hypothetical protein